MNRKLSCFIVLLSIPVFCLAQSVQDQMTKRQPACRDVLINASDVLSKLYGAKEFDSIRIAVDVMQEFYGEQSPEVFYVNTLLSIQQHTFSVKDFSANGRFDTILHLYSFTLKALTANGYAMSKYQYHFFSVPEKKFYQLIQTWAMDLLSRRNLTSSESFICNMLAGNFKRPEAVLRSQKAQYPDLYALLQNNYARERSQATRVLTFMSGIWLPSEHLKILGAHRSIGFQMGGRGKSNEFDLTLLCRFGNTRGMYYVSRSDSLFALDHFLGGYIGLDYSHYFFQAVRWEAGLTGGVGYDGFDIADPASNDHSEDYLKPFSIGSLNLNAGVRVNYFFNPHFLLASLQNITELATGTKMGAT